MNLNSRTNGMKENPIAWKMLNLEQQYASFVKKVASSNNDVSSLKNRIASHNNH